MVLSKPVAIVKFIAPEICTFVTGFLKSIAVHADSLFYVNTGSCHEDHIRVSGMVARRSERTRVQWPSVRAAKDVRGKSGCRHRQSRLVPGSSHNVGHKLRTAHRRHRQRAGTQRVSSCIQSRVIGKTPASLHQLRGCAAIDCCQSQCSLTFYQPLGSICSLLTRLPPQDPRPRGWMRAPKCASNHKPVTVCCSGTVSSH